MQHGYDHDLFHTQIKISRLPSLDIMSLQIVGSDLTNDGVPAMWNKMMTKIEVSIQDMLVHTTPAPLLSSWSRRYKVVMTEKDDILTYAWLMGIEPPSYMHSVGKALDGIQPELQIICEDISRKKVKGQEPAAVAAETPEESKMPNLVRATTMQAVVALSTKHARSTPPSTTCPLEPGPSKLTICLSPCMISCAPCSKTSPEFSASPSTAAPTPLAHDPSSIMPPHPMTQLFLASTNSSPDPSPLHPLTQSHLSLPTAVDELQSLFKDNFSARATGLLEDAKTAAVVETLEEMLMMVEIQAGPSTTPEMTRPQAGSPIIEGHASWTSSGLMPWLEELDQRISCLEDHVESEENELVELCRETIRVTTRTSRI
ncbi:hypothetical protein EDD16DRAFT_1721943 [Pisolithus croceorrhizus]|nr:hypothetical protein EDD16DRAFT_1721943 [Pisolithus croceorrhizus]